MAPASAPIRRAGSDTRGNKAAQPMRNIGETDVQLIVRELAAVADYIAHMKKEIGALRANELCRDRLPMAHDELGSVVKATASATHTIMSAAEDILGMGEAPYQSYRDQVETRVMEIFEACSFQDITGQRIGKVLEALGQLEKRLNRFASAVNARDLDDIRDPEEVLRAARREVLLLNGPAREGEGVNQDDVDQMMIDQDDIDKLFG